MSEATAPLPVLESPQTLEDLVAAQNALLEQNLAAMAGLERRIRAAAMSQGELTEFVIAVNRVTDIEKVMLDVADRIRQAAMLRTLEQAREALRPALAPAPEPAPARHRHRRSSRRREPGEGQGTLFPVRGLLPVAAAWAALRHVLHHPAAAKALEPLRSAAGHVLHHGPIAKVIAAAPSVKAAAIAAAGTAAVATVGAVAVVTLTPSHAGTPAFGSAGAPAPAASIEAAAPFPSSTPIALLATHPKGKHPGRKAALSGTGVLLPPPYAPVTQPSSSAPSSSSPSQSASSAAGPAVITADTAAIDLTANPQATITLTATGGGWASWRITTTGTDLDFSVNGQPAAHGVLQAGQSVTITVSLDVSQDGNLQQVFTVAGQQVTVSLPPLPSVQPSAGTSVIPSQAPAPNPSAS